MQGNFGKIEVVEDLPYCDGKELAACLGLSKGRISQLTSEGLFVREATDFGELYEMNTAVQAYIERQSQSGSAEDAKIRRERSKAESAIKKSKAVIAALEAEELRGKMFRAEDIQAITEDFLYEIRSMINALPGQLAVDVANATNAAECSAIIQTVINRMLLDLSKYRFDQARYEERIRERQNWETRDEDDSDDAV